MSLRIVSNSTPIIALCKIKRFEILRELFGTIVIPEAVRNEVADIGKKRSGSVEILTHDWVRMECVKNRTVIDFLLVSVDPGEAEAIALAKESSADLLLIDDRAGRRIAQTVGVTIAGTIGVLLRYYRHDSRLFKQALDDLIATGFRISKLEYQRMLQLSKQ